MGTTPPSPPPDGPRSPNGAAADAPQTDTPSESAPTDGGAPPGPVSAPDRPVAAAPERPVAAAPNRPAGPARRATSGRARASGRRPATVAAPPVNTLAIDIGGTGLKASVLDSSGQMQHERVRVATPYPLSPVKLVTVLEDLIKPLPPFDRVSVGFPGMVRGGQILSAPHFVSPDGPSGEPVAKLVKAWARFDLESELARVTGKPTKVANDADIQGAAVVAGNGLEAVVTLGTGVGTAFFLEGLLLPHFEFAHHPFRKGLSYNDWIGESARRSIGHKKWQRRVLDAVDAIRQLTFFDHCFLGGGNSSRIDAALPEDVSLVDNSAGIVGGIKLWERTG